MDAMSVLENSYYIINKNFGFYKRNYGHIYYLNVQDDETKFIDKMFGKVENELSAQDKMLNYSISAIYMATAVLIEILNRSRIEFNEKQIEKICVGFSDMNNNEISFADKTEEELDEILFGLLTDGIDLESRKKSGSERTPDEIIKYMLDIIGYDGLIMCPGEELGKSFTYVAEKSFKCQRSIPMNFFEEFKGQVVFNP